MSTPNSPYRQGVHHAMTALRGQWTAEVLAALALGPRQYKELLASVNDVEERSGWATHSKPLTERTLTDTVRRAQDSGLIDRHAESAGRRFGSVSYSLTPKGRALLKALRPLAEWGLAWAMGQDGDAPRESA